jgi:hypothetical protein
MPYSPSRTAGYNVDPSQKMPAETHLCSLQGCANDRKQLPSGNYCSAMDPLSITVSGMTIVGGVVATASKANTFGTDYRNADKERLQIQRQKDHLQINRSLLNKVSTNIKSRLPNLDSCLADIEAALPSKPPNATKRNRLTWATGAKNKAKAEIGLLKDIESATSLTILFSVDEKL